MRASASSAAAAVLLLASTTQARVEPAPFPDTLSAQRHANVLPWWTKIRDTAVELFFGSHPTKSAPPSASNPQPRARYADELVLRFNVSHPDEEQALAEASARLFLDVWAFTHDFVDIRMHSRSVAPLLALLPPSLRAAHSTLIPDVAQAVYALRPDAAGSDDPSLSSQRLVGAAQFSPGSEDNLFFQDYQPLPVITRWLRLLEAMFPSHVEHIVIGQTFEGREITALRVGLSKLSNPTQARKTIVVTGGLHAREWISTTTVNYLAWSFVTMYGKERVITKVLEEFDIVFIPVMNPDGVEYTWSVDRLWRKSRQRTSFRLCAGMDLDHSFGYAWDGSHIQSDPCSESFGGDEPFQAIEALEFANWARNQTMHNVKFVGLLDLHSYSQQILFPYSHSCAATPPNLENLEELGAGLAKAVRLSSGEAYSVTSACEGAAVPADVWDAGLGLRLESGGGSAIDWFYHEMQAHYSYQVKLRDTGSYGFLLPKEEIIPTGQEMLNALKYFGDYLLGNNGIEKHFDVEAEDAAPPYRADGDDQHSTPAGSQELRKRRVGR